MPASSIRLRKALKTDRSLIHSIIRAKHLNPMGLDWRRFFVAEDQTGRVVGCAQIKPHGDGTRELASLVVLEPYRGQGIARRLVETLLAQSNPPLYLTCRSGLVPFYERFGFRLLDDQSLTPYFRWLKRLASVLVGLLRSSEGMAVMIWSGTRNF